MTEPAKIVSFVLDPKTPDLIQVNGTGDVEQDFYIVLEGLTVMIEVFSQKKGEDAKKLAIDYINKNQIKETWTENLN